MSLSRIRPEVWGEYTRTGYSVLVNEDLVYSALDHRLDSQQPALCKQDRLSVPELRRFCERTALEIAGECGGRFSGVCRMKEAA